MVSNTERLDIDSSYLKDLQGYPDGHWIEKLEDDISSLVDNAEIHIGRHLEEGQLSLYKDVRSFMVRAIFKNSHKNYTIFPFSDFEANRISAVAGYENVIGNYKTGLRLIGKHQYAPDYSSVLGLKRHKE